MSETAPKASAKRKPRAKKLSKLDENAAEGDESVKPIAEPEAVEPALGDTHDVPEKTRKGGERERKRNPKITNWTTGSCPLFLHGWDSNIV